jgi:two-component system chemotaxis response regulator CheY
MTGEADASGYALVVGAPDADRGAVEQALLGSGLSVAAATPGETLAARDLIPPRLVVLDDSGGREDRMGVLRHLLAHPPLQGVPILVLAYDGDVDSFTSAITKGAAAYLVKPVDDAELLAASQRLCDWAGSNDRTEKRRRLRRPLLMKVEVDIRARKLRVPGYMLDASSGGCRVELSEAVAEGEAVRVVLHARDDTTHLALGAQVRWHYLRPSGFHLVGLKFTGTTAMLAGKLLGFASVEMT